MVLLSGVVSAVLLVIIYQEEFNMAQVVSTVFQVCITLILSWSENRNYRTDIVMCGATYC
jgi:hypothetical protein